MLVRRRTPSFARFLLFLLAASSAALLLSSLAVAPSDARMAPPLPWNWNDGQGDEDPFFTDPSEPTYDVGGNEQGRVSPIGIDKRTTRSPAPTARSSEETSLDRVRQFFALLSHRLLMGR